MEHGLTTRIRKNGNGIKVQDMYKLPFKSQFELKAALFQKMKDLYHIEILNVIKKYTEREAEIDPENDAVVWLAVEKKLFQKVNREVLRKAWGDY